MHTIAVLAGSFAQDSLTQKTLNALFELARKTDAPFEFITLDLLDLPLYDRDLDAKVVPKYDAFRSAIKSASGIIWITPEHNGTLPAALKNAVDIGSRPYGHSVWGGKVLGILSVSIGATGGKHANQAAHDLAQAPFVDLKPIDATLTLGKANDKFDGDALICDATREQLVHFLETFTKALET